jgi:endonuclease/exonuclease/phosphatase family metal-dependent hydrolase
MTHRSTKTLAAAFLASIAALVALALAGFGGEADARPNAPERGFTAMTYNIHHGVGVDGELDLDRTAEVIRAADAEVVGLQEVDNNWSARSDFQDQAKELAERLGMHYVYAANLDREPLEPGGERRQYGTAILSEYPILESENTLLPRPEGGEQRGLLEALINVRGVPVRVYNTHLQHNSAVERTAQVEAIMSHAGELEEPTLLVGDLNARPDAPEMQPLYTRFEDAWVEGDGPGYTYPAEAPDRRIDYVLVSPDVSVGRAYVPRTLASDHLPVVAEVKVPGEAVGIGRPGR